MDISKYMNLGKNCLIFRVDISFKSQHDFRHS